MAERINGWRRFAVAACLVMVGAGCSGGSSSDGASTTASTTETTTTGGESTEPTSTTTEGTGSTSNEVECPEDLRSVSVGDDRETLQQCVADEWETLAGRPLPDFAALAQAEPLVRFYSLLTMLAVPADISPWAEVCIVAAGYDELEDSEIGGLLLAPAVESLSAADQETVARVYERWNSECLAELISPETIYGTDLVANMATCATPALSLERLQLLGNADPSVSEERAEMVDDVHRRVGSCGGQEAQDGWMLLADYGGPLGL